MKHEPESLADTIAADAPARQGAPHPAAVPVQAASTDDEARYLQERISLVSLISAVLSGGAVGLLLLARYLSNGTIDHSSHVLQIIGVLTFIAAWQITKGRPRSKRVLAGLDASICGGLGLCMVLSPIGSPFWIRPELIAALIVMIGTGTRAAIVPSSALRTAIVSLLPWGAVFVVGYVTFREPVNAAGEMRALLRETLTRIGIWTILGVVQVSIISHVIYGLRREIREAKKLGQYTLLDKLGEGGMGQVFRAQHAMLRRPTAVKLLHPDRAGGPEDLARFEREVQLTAQLSHPNIVTVFDYGRTPDGVFYYAMELLDGQNLEDVIEETGAM